MYRSHTTADIAGVPERGEVILGGMIAAIKSRTTKNPQPGQPSKLCELRFGRCRWRDPLHPLARAICGNGQPDPERSCCGPRLDRPRGGEEANLIVNELIPLDQLEGRYTSGIVVRISESEHGPDTVATVREIVRTYPGNSELKLHVSLDDGSRVYMKSHRVRIDVTNELRNRLDDLLGPGNFQLITSPPKPSSDRNNGRRPFRSGGAR